jgi:hypothetical protein
MPKLGERRRDDHNHEREENQPEEVPNNHSRRNRILDDDAPIAVGELVEAERRMRHVVYGLGPIRQAFV